jgi:hypothetical protein
MVVSPLGSQCEACGVSPAPTTEHPECLLRHAGEWLCADCLDEVLQRTVMVGCVGRWSEELDSLCGGQAERKAETACG